MFSKTFFATLLASSAVASPLVSTRAANGAFGLVSIRSGSSIQNAAINAAGGNFWIGKATSSDCPLSSGCPAGTYTSFTSSGDRLNMNVIVPGGQQVYIGTNYALSFTTPHSADTKGGKSEGFQYTAGTGNSAGSLSFADYGFLACASTEGEGIYQIYATPGGEGTGNCTSIAIGTLANNNEGASAWEYI